MGLRMKNLIFLGLTEKSDFYEGGGGGGHKKPIYRGDCLKWEAWTVCRFKEGDLARGSGVFDWGGWYPNAHYDLVELILREINSITIGVINSLNETQHLFILGIKGLWFVNHESISWSHKSKIWKTSIFHELPFQNIFTKAFFRNKLLLFYFRIQSF